ncbi:MAG: glucose-6-phosphate dehydrogenase assembly protein OpcA, partial [Anaerolineae bacterium]|nr:glucose-6-phosphate dehydrogenase assembly protein OpcA [Anaerolineae bacterium]
MVEPVRVSDPAVIERVLAEQRQASLLRAGPEVPPVRATALNLIVYAGDPASAGELAAVAAALAEEHPSRTILLAVGRPSGREEWEIQAWARCHRALPRYLVCFEGVQILAGQEVLERAPAVILPLLLRDLPVVLWWPGEVPTGAPLFLRLLANTDRLVVDSASAADPEALLPRLTALAHAEQCQCAIGDLNWRRLTPWRELTAQLFDPPDSRPCLRRIERVRLECAEAPGRRDATQAYLFTAWLATRLGWAPAPLVWSEGAEGERMNLLRGAEPVSVDLVRLPLRDGTAGLQRVSFHAAPPEGQATFAVQRSPDASHAAVTAALPG